MPYYFNSATAASQWEPPAESNLEVLKVYMERNHPSGAPPGKIRCSHLLVKHEGSRRPASWREVRFCFFSAGGRGWEGADFGVGIDH